MVDILNEVNGYLNIEALNSDTAVLAAVIATAVLAVIYCFFGYKAIRFIAFVLGFILGAAIGSVVVSNYTSLTYPVNLAVILGAAVVLALLSALLFRFGIFLMVLIGVWGVAYTFIMEYASLEQVFAAIIALVIAVILALLAVIYLRPVVIAATALEGGFMLSGVLFEHLIHIRWSSELETLVRLGTGLLLALIGIIYQFVSTRDMD